MNEKNIIGGISIETWRKAFAELASNAIDHDDFSDILFFDLYPGTHEEANGIDEDDEDATNAIDEDDEDAICNIYNEKWEFVDEAFKAIFGVDRHLV